MHLTGFYNPAQVHFKVKSHTKFQKIMDAYAGKRSVDVSAIRFLYDGSRLDGSSTPGKFCSSSTRWESFS